MARSVTLQDVAAAAGVSVATASRALAGKDRVSAATIARVREAAAALDYRVDPIARALREGATRIVGMVVPVVANPYYAQLVGAVEVELHRHGLELLLADSHADPEEEARRLALFVERKVDGIVIAATDASTSATALRALARRTAVVQVDRVTGPSVADFAGVDNDVAMALAVDHVAACGAASVAYVGADATNTNGVERWEAARRHAERAGLELHEPFRQAFDVETGVAAADALLARGPLPDALVTGADLIALGLVARLREHGVEVPDDVMVTGFDGTIMSSLVFPTLTTVVQPVEAIAREAIGFLVDRIDGSEAPVRSTRLVPTLREGGSTRPR